MEELDIIEILYALKKKIKYIIATVVIFAIAGLIYSKFLVTPMYRSSTTFVLSKSTDNTNTQTTGDINSEAITQNDVTLNSKLVSTYSVIIKSKTIAKEVIDSLGLDMGVDELISSVTVTSKDDTELIEIAVTTERPEYAAQIANETAKVFTQKVAEFYNINNVNIVDEAEVETNTSNINHTKDIIIFAFMPNTNWYTYLHSL